MTKIHCDIQVPYNKPEKTDYKNNSNKTYENYI